MKRTIRSSERNARTCSKNHQTWSGVSADVGSSRTRIRGAVVRACMISSICRSARRSSRTGLPGSMLVTPKEAIIAFAVRRERARAKAAALWSTTPSCRRGS